MARINITRLVIFSRRKTNSTQYFTQVDVPCFFIVIDWIIVQEVFNEETILRYSAQEEDTQYFT